MVRNKALILFADVCFASCFFLLLSFNWNVKQKLQFTKWDPKKNATYCVRKSVYSNARQYWNRCAQQKHTHTQTTYQKKNIKEEKNVCCFLNIYGRPISTVIILVKNINFMSVSVFRLCIFDHAIIWLHLAIQHVSVPNKCRPSQPNMLLLCNDFVVVVFGFFFIYFFHFYTIFFGIGVIPSSYLLWILELLSILQLKFNERLDYRICGQSSSNPLCFQYRMKLYTFFAMCSDPEPEIHLSVVFWLHFGVFTWTVCVSVCFITNASPINHMATV